MSDAADPQVNLAAGIAIERSIHLTGRCLCGRRPRLRERARRWVIEHLTRRERAKARELLHPRL